MVTIKDIARVAGVSYSTVSKALNNSPLVQEKTKQKILKIAEELGYQPNIAAKKLVSNKSKTIGVVWPTVNRVTLSTIVTKINEEIENASYSMILSINPLNSAVNMFKRFQVDGIVVFDDQELSDQHLEANIPIVFLGGTNGRFPSIDVCRRDAFYNAVQYLHSLGHRHLAFVGHLPHRNNRQFEKYIGFTEALIHLGINPQPEMFINTEGLYLYHGYEAMKKLLKSDYQPTAVVGGSYEITEGIIRAVKEAGLKIPDDISVIGYDNIPQMENLEVPVTAVGAPVDKIAKTTVDVLISHINNPSEKAKVYKVEPEIFERKSCRPISE
ncbi:transcriptional regulator, LacI family [Caldalkalibacillus thermarum TA2.A1]|uniref:LacI family transcriptional regulator n=1 Tax=Caldalkalibacillus thermarum (strain TA2.A1) TaxID=986075 RepID=F5LAT6_CALTT|nr:LacI family DNA-binding transcriptional regulator [Caldalkalibacillus thermarum]EGL81475.1 transcriptional regulator, LacI family [Caldalkalibacillus thermarum TA2.A1]QZT33782.1 LacI family transcriptional regulator [Caldalkalibacillus thermarum TA2.A1]